MENFTENPSAEEPTNIVIGDPEPRKGKVVSILRSGARIVEYSANPAVGARLRAESLRVDGETMALYEDAVLEDADGSVILHLTCADLTDVVMVGWSE